MEKEVKELVALSEQSSGVEIKEGICAYKNCGRPIIGGRKHKKFCCRGCKENNRKINKYFKVKEENKKEE